MSHPPEQVGAIRLPPIRSVSFSQRFHDEQGCRAVSMTGRNNEGTLSTCGANNSPRQAGESHDVIAGRRVPDVRGAAHQHMEGRPAISTIRARVGGCRLAKAFSCILRQGAKASRRPSFWRVFNDDGRSLVMAVPNRTAQCWQRPYSQRNAPAITAEPAPR